MEVIAKTRNLRMSARKVRLVVDMIRGLDAHTAISRLRMIAKASKVPIEKLVASALANAEHNFRLDKGTMFIKKIFVDEGSALKRWRARAYGRAAPIRKHSCHITVVLDERIESKKKKTSKNDEKKVKTSQKVTSDVPRGDVDVKTPRNEDHTPIITDPRRLGKHRNSQNSDRKELHQKKGFTKTFFNRKSGS